MQESIAESTSYNKKQVEMSKTQQESMKKMVKDWSEVVSNYKEENGRMMKELHSVRLDYYRNMDELSKVKESYNQLEY